MKILCDRPQLQEAFSIVAAIAPQKTPKPILQNVLLRAEGESLTLYATDFEMSCRVALDSVKVAKSGVVLLPARETSALLRELADPTLTLESSGGSFVLVGDDPEQFPKEPEVGKGTAFQIPAGEFVAMARRTMFAAAREESRYMVNGVLFDLSDDCLRMVATDGRRLALTYCNLETEAGLTIKEVVPLPALQTLVRALPEDSKDPLTVTFLDNQVAFSFETTSLISQLLECNFPEYEAVIPKAAETSVDLGRQELEQNLRRVAVLSSGDLRVVRFMFGSDSLQMSAENSGVGRADQSMPAHIKGADVSISFNPDYLLEALKVTDRDSIRVDMTDDSTPAKITLGEAYTYVLMPISGS